MWQHRLVPAYPWRLFSLEDCSAHSIAMKFLNCWVVRILGGMLQQMMNFKSVLLPFSWSASLPSVQNFPNTSFLGLIPTLNCSFTSGSLIDNFTHFSPCPFSSGSRSGDSLWSHFDSLELLVPNFSQMSSMRSGCFFAHSHKACLTYCLLSKDAI